MSAGKEDIVDRLLEISETDVTIQNRNGATALYLPHPLILTTDTTRQAKTGSMYLIPLPSQANLGPVLQIVARQIDCPTSNERYTGITPYPPRRINRIYNSSKSLHVPHTHTKIRLPHQRIRPVRHDPPASCLRGRPRRNGTVISRVGRRYRSNR